MEIGWAKTCAILLLLGAEAGWPQAHTVPSPGRAPTIIPLIAKNSWWRYFHTGSEPSGPWYSREFADAGWEFGPGQFGWGDLDEATRLSPAVASPLACYFRHQFTVTNAWAFTNLAFDVLRDDGVIVYLNGEEAFRMNMPTGVVVTAATFALNPVSEGQENVYFSEFVDARRLREGTNTIAVQLHQTGPTAADASFDLALTAIGPPAPHLRLNSSAGKVVLQWDEPDVVLEQADSLQATWTIMTDAMAPYEISVDSGVDQRFFRLKRKP